MNKIRKQHLREAVCNCLLNTWDPLGVSGIEEAANEYDSYVSGICKMLTGADAYRLREHLAQLEAVSMGLSQESRTLDQTVDELLAISENG